MKSNKGVTLISLIGYVVLSIMVIGVLTVITANFKKNFNELNVQTVHEVELDKINLQISKEIQEGSKVDKDNTSEHELIFIDGNTYTYVAEDGALYLNNKIAIAEHLTNCTFEIVNDESLLRVTASIEEKTRVMEYVLDKANININDLRISLGQNIFLYDGTSKKPNITISDGSKVLEEGTDYTVTGEKIDAGNYQINITRYRRIFWRNDFRFCYK